MQHLDSKIIQRSQGSYEEICTIKLQEGYSIRAIARYLRRHASTIKREIDRGTTHNGTYFAESTERHING